MGIKAFWKGVFAYQRQRDDPSSTLNRFDSTEMEARQAHADEVLEKSRALRQAVSTDRSRIDSVLHSLSLIDLRFKKSLAENHYALALEHAFRGEEK